MKLFGFWTAAAVLCLFGAWEVNGILEINEEELFYTETNASYYNESKAVFGNNALLVGLTLIKSAAAKGAGNLTFKDCFFSFSETEVCFFFFICFKGKLNAAFHFPMSY
jgi:hypothetical protein